MHKLEDRAASDANLGRIKADAENKRIMAERGRLKLERELGNVIYREDYERELAARAQFFKREIETFGSRLGADIINLVVGDEHTLPLFNEFWQEQTASWMDGWSSDRTFVLGESPQEEAEEIEEVEELFGAEGLGKNDEL